MKGVLATVALILLASASAQTQSAAPPESLATKVDRLFAPWDRKDTPGCSVAAIQGGRIAYGRGYGMASLELSVPIATSSVFNAGSMAKQFTVMSILMLAQKGQLALDDNIRKYIPEVPDFGQPITLRHLISHTSGLRDFLEMLEMAGWRTGGDLTTEKDILNMVSRQRTLNHTPGEAFVYTNTGYVLLAMVIKRATNQSLRDFAETNIFKPLGMNNTHFYDDHRAIIKGLVNGYLPDKEAGFLKWMPAADYTGTSNLFTTVEDLALWDENFYDKKVGGAAVIDQMQTAGTLTDGSPLEYVGGLYAGGLIVTSYKGLKNVFHGGSTLGYQGTLHRFPEQHFSVAVLCNVRYINPDALARGVADIYLANHLKPTASQSQPIVAPPNVVKLSENELASVSGLYWNRETDTVRRVYVKDGKLMYFRSSGNESELAPLGGTRFLMLGVRNRVEITFQSPRQGVPSQLLFEEAGRKPVTQQLVKPASYTRHALSEFAGEYFSPEVNATYKITPKDDKLLIQTGNWGDFLLSPRFFDSFANPEEMGSLVFTRDRRNRVSGFVMRSGKVRNLKFNKIK